MRMKRLTVALAAIFALVTSPAFAHSGVGAVFGFPAGFGHAISGLDHILAMVAVDILASQQGGRSVWAVPVVCQNSAVQLQRRMSGFQPGSSSRYAAKGVTRSFLRFRSACQRSY